MRRSRYRPTMSLKRCQRMAAGQGLAVYRLPLEHGLVRRYAITRGDDYTKGPIMRYRGIQAVCDALNYPQDKGDTHDGS